MKNHPRSAKRRQKKKQHVNVPEVREQPVIPPQISQPQQTNPGFFDRIRRNWGKLALGLFGGALIGGLASRYRNQAEKQKFTMPLFAKKKIGDWKPIPPLTDDENKFFDFGKHKLNEEQERFFIGGESVIPP